MERITEARDATLEESAEWDLKFVDLIERVRTTREEVNAEYFRLARPHQSEAISQVLTQILEALADPEAQTPKAFGTPEQGREPSPDTILRLHHLFDEPLAQARYSLDSNRGAATLLDQFRQEWSTCLFNEYIIRKHERALHATYQELRKVDLTTTQTRLITAAVKTIRQARDDPHSYEHSQIGL